MALIVIMNSSCSGPSKINGGCGTENYKHKFRAQRQWMRERSDGYWVVTSVRMMCAHKTIFECKPDSAALAQL